MYVKVELGTADMAKNVNSAVLVVKSNLLMTSEGREILTLGRKSLKSKKKQLANEE